MEDSSLWRALWLNRLNEYLSVTETRLRNLRNEAGRPDLLPRTSERVLRVVAAFEDQRARVEALFGLLKEGGPAIPPSAMPSRPEHDGKLAIVECYEHLFRDWSWGEREGALSRSLVERVMREPLGRLAVYGAGAGRLAFDVHQTLRPDETLALDINPLPLLIADKLVRGEAVDLYEFPVAPNSEEHIVVMRHLQGPAPVREGFNFIFADALRPPFAPGSLDSVLTPWFIDAVHADFRETAVAINRVLRPGGLWINLGPLRFSNALSRSYTIEEVFDIVGRSAFDLLSHMQEDLPYFDSPVSGSRRIDTVFCFAARKTGEATWMEAPSLIPRWVTDPTLPIPPTPSMVALQHSSVFTAGVLSLVDGARSMSDIARVLGGSWGVDPTLVQDQLRPFFARLPPN